MILPIFHKVSSSFILEVPENRNKNHAQALKFLPDFKLSNCWLTIKEPLRKASVESGDFWPPRKPRSYWSKPQGNAPLKSHRRQDCHVWSPEKIGKFNDHHLLTLKQGSWYHMVIYTYTQTRYLSMQSHQSSRYICIVWSPTFFWRQLVFQLIELNLLQRVDQVLKMQHTNRNRNLV